MTGMIMRLCKSSEKFNAETGSCWPSSNITCTTVDCTKTIGNGLFAPYGDGSKYFAACIPRKAPLQGHNIEMYQCAKGFEFDSSPSVSQCVYQCYYEGKFEYSFDETKYVECSYRYGKLVASVESCYPGVFIAADGDCGFKMRKLPSSSTTEVAN
jgi:hypothetical protein